jgi:oligopeptide/dipeptide ABC transporter ATP-binding protein
VSEILLKVDNLKKHFPIHGGFFHQHVGNVYAVDGINFEVEKGETIGIVGESGCGKSTLGKTLLMLHKPTDGRVLFEGVNLGLLSKKELRLKRKDIQIIFQDPYESLDTRMTVGTILSEPYQIHGIGTPKERLKWAEELLEKVGLPPSSIDRFPHEFSGGQRQRIGIARAIALKPKLILCDEPVSALDVSVQSQILNLLIELQKELELTYLFIAHDLAVVKHISDRIAVMYLGKIVEFTDADTLYQKALHPYTQALIKSIPQPDPKLRAELLALEGEVPSPIFPPSGCHFHTRCPYATQLCKSKVPPLAPAPGTKGDKHLVSCHYAGEVG